MASDGKAAAAKRPVYHLLEAAFLQKNQDFAYKREGPHLKSLEAKCLARPDPEGFAKTVLLTFLELIEGEAPLFKDQPFLPSILDSGGLWPRVLKQVEKRAMATPAGPVREVFK